MTSGPGYGLPSGTANVILRFCRDRITFSHNLSDPYHGAQLYTDDGADQRQKKNCCSRSLRRNICCLFRDNDGIYGDEVGRFLVGTKYAILRKKYAQAKTERRIDYAPHLEDKLQRIHSDIAADEKVLVDLQERIKPIKPVNRKLAIEELESRKINLGFGAAAPNEATTRCDEFQTRLLFKALFP